MEKKGKNNWVALTFIFIMMVLIAITENTKGIFIPGFKAEFGVNDAQIGNMIILTSLMYMFATFIGGTLCQKIGQKKVFIIGLVTIICSLLILSRADSYNMLLVGIGISSAGVATIAIASNTIIPVIVLTAQTIIMNVTHFCYGLGSTIGQRLFGVLTADGINWRTMYFGLAIVYVVVLVVFLFVKMPRVEKAEEEQKIPFIKLMSNKLILFYMIALGFYAFAEQGTGNWFVNYMQVSYGFDYQRSSFYLSLFFGIFSIGRLFGGIVVEKLGYFNVLITSVLVGSILFIIGITIGSSGMALVSLAGLFYSIIFPTTVLTISKVFNKNSAYITGIVITASSFIAMILNRIIGNLNELVGTSVAFYLLPISGVISALAMIYIYIKTKDVLVKKNN